MRILCALQSAAFAFVTLGVVGAILVIIFSIINSLSIGK